MAEVFGLARRRTTVLVTALVGLVVLLVGCSTGQRGYATKPVSSGSVGQVGDMAVLDALFPDQGRIENGTVYRPGDTVDLQATIVNTGGAADQLVSVSSPIAGGGVILGDGTVPGRHALAAGYPQSVPSTTLPDTTQIGLRLTNLSTAIRVGLTYPVVFAFSRAGTLRLQLRAANPDVARAECPLPPDGKVPQIYTAPIGRAPVPPTTSPPDCSTLR